MKKALRNLAILANAALILAGGLGIAFAGYKTMHTLPIRKYFPNVRTNAAWEWRNVNGLVDEAEATAVFLNQHQINTVYLDISSVLTPKSTEASEKFDTNVQKYIAVMKAHTIRVVASGGDKTWSKPESRHLPMQLTEYMFNFNKNNPTTKFTGMEFDIEAYNQPEFEPGSFTRKGIILSEYLDTVDTLAAQFEDHLKTTSDSDVELGFAVPYWFDNQNKNIKSVTWEEKTGPTIYHVLDRLNKLPKSNIIVMAYRNAARGNNGTIALSRTEVQYAQYKADKVRVIIGQESTKVQPEKITFYGKSKTELSEEVKWVEEQFSSVPTYGGIAINDLEGYSALPD